MRERTTDVTSAKVFPVLAVSGWINNVLLSFILYICNILYFILCIHKHTYIYTHTISPLKRSRSNGQFSNNEHILYPKFSSLNFSVKGIRDPQKLADSWSAEENIKKKAWNSLWLQKGRKLSKINITISKKRQESNWGGFHWKRWGNLSTNKINKFIHKLRLTNKINKFINKMNWDTSNIFHEFMMCL